ncbi:MAG: hypothetical protein ACOYL5_02760 [Phototrophicaceae bacterium]|jgi:hypothetical protein
MLDSAIIQVIIGMVFVYILLSLLVSQINQIISNLMNIRGHQLRQRIENIIQDESLQEQILSHPIVGVIHPAASETELQNRQTRTAKISNVASSTVAKAILNVLADPYVNMYAALTKVKDKLERERLQNLVNQIRVNISDTEQANVLLQQLHEMILALQPEDREDRRTLLRNLRELQIAIHDQQTPSPGMLPLLNGVNQVRNTAFQQTMETVLSGVQRVEDAQLALEQWFDDKMSQTKDRYQRTMGYFSLGIGLLLAVLLNVDSLQLARTLWTDSALREQVSLAANAAFTIGTEQAASDANNNGGLFGLAPTDPSAEPDTVQVVVNSFQDAQLILGDLLELHLPIGWTLRFPIDAQAQVVGAEAVAQGASAALYDPLKDTRNLYNIVPFVSPNWLVNLLVKLAGLFVTAFGVAQGAPFWFDVLRRISGQQSPSKAEQSQTQ